MAKRKLKREKQKPVTGKRTQNLYPVCYCFTEKKVIAVSSHKISLKADRFGNKRVRDGKVSIGHWLDGVQYGEGMYLDFAQFKDGDLVLCPNCSNKVDFCVFPSATTPTLNKVIDETDKQGYMSKYPRPPKA
jgi:hypothetical protein